MNKRKPLGHKGFGLILLVIVSAIVGILGLTAASSFMSQASQTQLRIDQAKARYLAQAGVTRAVWDWFVTNIATSTAESARRYTHNSSAGSNGTTVIGNTVFKFGYNGNEGAPSIVQSAFAQYIMKPKIELVKSVGNAQVYAAGTTVAVTVPAAGVAKNNLVVVYVAMDGLAAGGNVTCADTQGNTYASGASISDVRFVASSNANMRVAILYSLITTALVSGNSITVTMPSVTAKAMSVAEFSGVTVADQVLGVVNSGTGTGSASVAPTSATVTTTQADELITGAIGVEGVIADTFTPTNSFLTNPPVRLATANATRTNNALIDPEYKIVSATGNYAATATITSADYAAAIATFYEPPANWFTSGANRQLRQWRLKNIHTANTLTLAQIKVSWTPTNAAVLNDFVLNGVSKWPGGTFASGSTINITDTVLNAGDSWSGTTTYLQWNAVPPDPVAVTVQFIYADDSATLDSRSDEVVLWNGAQAGGGLPTKRTFTVTGTGEVTQTAGTNNFKVLNSIKAVVSGTPGNTAYEITDWDDEDKNIP